MALDTDPNDYPLSGDLDELAELFRAAQKPESQWRIGAEAEKFGVDATTGAPLMYDGERGVLRVFASLVEHHAWRPVRETPEGPIIALEREDASVTLEPGAQLELSGAPLPDVHAICAEMRGHLRELSDISSEMNLVWLGVGFHPLARQADLSWVPKARYAIMREYLPTRGSGGQDMMRRTATVQANYDYSSERDAMQKLAVCFRVAQLVNAMTANSPFYEGRASGKKSERGDVWLRMDPSRSGLVRAIVSKDEPGYRDYVEWALDAGMFLIKRDGKVVANTGQTFRSFLADGFQGHRAMFSDWKGHLATLFPETRLKTTLEVRMCDSLPAALACSVPALFAGLLYDARALERATEFSRRLDLTAVEQARHDLVTHGLGASIGGVSARDLALELLDISESGLERRARLSASGSDERIHLRRLRELTEAGQSPADALLEGLSNDDPDLARELVARTRV